MNLRTTNSFNSFVRNDGVLGLQTVNDTLNFNKIVTGSGSVIRDGGSGTLNIGTPTQQVLFRRGNAVITVGTTEGLVVGTPVSGAGILDNTFISEIISTTQYRLSQAPVNQDSLLGSQVTLNYLGRLNKTGSATIKDSQTVTISSTTGLAAGMAVSGSGIPAGSVILSVVNGTQFTISAPSNLNTTGQTLNFGNLNTYGGGFSFLDGGVANFNTPVGIGGQGVFIKGLENLTTVNFNQAVTVTGGGVHLKGTGDNILNGAVLNINAATNINGVLEVLGGDVRLRGTNGIIYGAGLTQIHIGGHGSTLGGNSTPGLNIINTAVLADDNIALDSSGNRPDRVPNAAPIVFDGGRLTFIGTGVTEHASSITFNETLGALRFASGSNLILTTTTNASSVAGSSKLTFSGFNGRAAGATVVFDSVVSGADSGARTAITGLTNTNNFIGGWAISSTNVGGSLAYEWAFVDGGGLVDSFGPGQYTTETAATWNNTNKHVKMTANQTVTTNADVASLNMQNGGSTLTLNGGTRLAVHSGGILASRGTQTISGNGFLTAGSGGGYELMVHLPTNQMNINSQIRNNGSNAVSLTKAGRGTLVLNPQSSRTAAFGTGSDTVNITSGGNTDIFVGSTVTGTGIPANTLVTAISGNTITLSQKTTQNTAGTGLTFGVASTFTGITTVNEGILEISREESLGANPAAFVANQLVLNAGRLRANSTFVMDDANRGITVGVGDAQISVANSRLLVLAGGSGAPLGTPFIDGRLGRFIFQADSNNQGAFEIRGDNDFSGGLETAGSRIGRTASISSSFDAGTRTIRISPALASSLNVGESVASSTTAFGIPAGSVITSIDVANGLVTIDKDITNDGASINLEYGGFNVMRLTGNNTIGFVRILGSEIDLRGTNTFTEDVLVNAGFLKLGHAGAGTNTFSSANGSLSINAGEIVLDSPTALLSANPDGYRLNLNGGILNLNGNDTRVSSLTGSGAVTSDAVGIAKISVTSNDSFSFSGTFRNSFVSSGTVSLEKNGSGVLSLTDTLSTYSGPTIINGGVLNAASIGFSTFPSSIGAATSAASNLVLNGGALRYNNTTAFTTDRSFTLGVGENAGALIADGSRLGAVSRWGTTTSPLIGFSGSGSRTLMLGGNNRGNNEFNLSLGDGLGGATSLTKTGNGTWVVGSYAGKESGIIYSSKTTAGNVTVTMTNTNGITVGQQVFGAGIPSGATVVSIVPGVSVNLSVPATSAGSPALRFGKGVTSGSTVVSVLDTTGVRVGQQVVGTGIPVGATVVSINPGVSVTLSTAATVTGDPVLRFSGNSYTGETLVLAGMLAATVDGAFGEFGGAGVVVGGGTNGATTLGNQNATVDLRNVQYTTVEQMTLAGGTLATTTGNSLWSGNVNILANSNILVGENATLTLNRTLTGGGSITQLGDGVLILSGSVDANSRNNAPAGLNPNYTVQAGTLRLDYSTNGSSKLADVGSLTLGGSRLGGALELTGGNHIEIVSATTIGQGSNRISRLSGTSILQMNAISVVAGSSVDFSANDIASTDTNNTNGILGGWATVGGNDWAAKSTFTEALVDSTISTGADKMIRGFTGYLNSSAANDWLSPTTANNGANISIMGPSTQNGRTPNTLRFNTPNNTLNKRDMTVTLTGTNTLQAGGILVGSGMGGDSAVIDGQGRLTGGAGSNAELRIYQNNLAAPMEISAVIANLAPASLAASTGSGSNTISGVNVAGLAAGLTVNGTGIPANATISRIDITDAVNQIGNIVLNGNATATGATTLNFTPVANGLVKNGAGNLILSGANTYSGVTSLNAGTLTINQLSVSGWPSTAVSAIRVNPVRTVQLVETAGLTFGQVVSGTGLPPVSTTAANTIAGQFSITVSSTVGLSTGLPVVGAGIPPGTTIQSIVGNTINLNNQATATANGQNLQFGGALISSINSDEQITLTNGSTLSATLGLNYSAVTALTGSIGVRTTNNSQVITLDAGGLTTAGITRGQAISGPNIPVGSVVETILDANRFTISLNATGSGTNATTFGSATIFTGTLASTTTSAARVSLPSTAGLTLGQTISGPGIPAGATIVRIVDGHNVDISAPVTSAGQNNLTYGVSGDIRTASTTNGSNAVTFASAVTDLQVGQSITGNGIPAGAIITSVISPTQVTISSAATATASSSLILSYPLQAVSRSGTTTSGSSNITLSTPVGAISVGHKVSGPGIPEGATVVAVISPTEITISSPAFATGAAAALSFAGAASSVGASLNVAGNLVLNGGVLQYNGTSAVSDRGITVASNGILDVGNAHTHLVMAGNIITPAAEDSYSIVKFGAGLLELRGTANQGLISGGGYGLEDLVVNDGTLRLKATFSDQFLRNDTGSLTMNGGAFELFGSADRSTTQNFVGAFTAGAGASIIRVANTGNVDTRLNLQDSTSPTKVNFQKGSSLLFVEDHNGTGNAIISLAGQFGTDVQVVLPRATYRTGIDVQNPGVNYFAFVDGNGYDVIASDNISIGGANAHTIRGNLADWETFMNVMDGALSSTAFYGVTNSNASVNTIRFYNSDFSRAARFTSGNTEVTNIDTTNLVVGQVVRANENILPFGTTFTIISIDTANNKIVLSAPAQATSTTDRLLIPDLHKSTITISDSLNVVGGAILQTTHAGNHVNSITGGLLTSGLNNSDGASADLIIHNWNPQLPFTISSTIGNNPTSGRTINLVHTGDGTTALAGTNTYTGETFLQGGVLRLDSLLALPSDNITYLDGGVIGLNYSGTFNRGLSDPAIVNPATAGRVRWTSSGGFAAYGAERTVSINGDNTTPLVWGSGGFVPDNDSLILGAQDSDNRLVFANAIDLGRKDRMVQVVSGRSGTIAEARLSGVITSDGGSLIKVGTGTLEITNDNANHNGGIVLAEGTLANASGLAAAQRAFGTGTVSIGTTTDTRSVGAHLTLDLRPTQSINMANNIVVGSANHSGLSMVQLENNTRVTALSGSLTLNRPTGRNFLVQTGGTTTNVALSGAISGTGGFTVNGGGTVTLSGTVPNTYGTLATAPSAAFDGSTVIRAGTLRVTSSGALSGGAIELGDATTALASVARATSGASVLGTDRDTVSFSADNRESLGGAFVSNANGLFDASGGFLTFPNAFGAFYNVSTTIDGLSFAPGSEGTRILVKDEIENPERNGIYTITRFNADGTMNLARTTDFSSTSNMTYGSQVAVTAGSSAGATFYNAAPSVTARNTPETGHNFWVRDTVNPAVTLTIDGPSVGTISQPIDVNATSTGAITIRATSAVTTPVTFSGPVTLQDVKVGAADVKTLNLDSAAPGLGMIFSGPVGQSVSGAADDVLSLAKSGTGGAALSGSNTYKGGTTVTQGSLFVNNTSGSGTGSGGITVSSGATLAGSGIIAPAAGAVTISIPTGANLSVGGPADTVGQALTLNLQQDNILNLAGNLRLDLFSNLPGSSTASEGDRLLFGNGGIAQVNLTGSTLMVNNAGSLTFNAGDSWKLIDWGTVFRDNTIFTGLDPVGQQYINDANLPTLNGGLMWYIGDLYTLGTITVAVPEPSRLLMLMFGLIALGFRRRRKSLQA